MRNCSAAWAPTRPTSPGSAKLNRRGPTVTTGDRSSPRSRRRRRCAGCCADGGGRRGRAAGGRLRRRPPSRARSPSRCAPSTPPGWAGSSTPDAPIVIVRNPDQDPADILWPALNIGYHHRRRTRRRHRRLDRRRRAAGHDPPGQHRPKWTALVLDVRQASEHASRAPTRRAPDRTRPPHRAGRRPAGPATTVMCGHGERAATAASLLERGRAPPTVHPGRRHPRTGPPPPAAALDTGRDRHRNRPGPVRLGLRANLAQFSLLVAVNALVGGMIGQERTVLPLLADQVFAVGAFTASLTFIVAFGITKALTNLAAGSPVRPLRPQTRPRRRLADRPAGAAAADLGTLLGLDHRRQHPARHQPGPDLVHHHRHEDRPRRPGPPRAGHGLQRGRRLPRPGRHRPGHRLAGRPARAAAGAVPTSASRSPPSASDCPRSSSRKPISHARHEARHPSPRTRRPPRWADRAADLHPHQLPREGAVRGQPGRAGQQPQRRPRLGPVPDPVRHLRPRRGPHRRPGRPLPGGVERRADAHRRAVGPVGPQVAHRRRHAAPGRRHRHGRRRHRLHRRGPSPPS